MQQLRLTYRRDKKVIFQCREEYLIVQEAHEIEKYAINGYE